MDYRRNMEINWPRQDPLESKLNMYERQIDQLFDFSYKHQDDIKTLFNIKDELHKCIDIIDKKISDANITHANISQLNICIQNYYQLELDNKRRMLNHECYQFQLFIVQLIIISYLIYLTFQ